MLGGEQSRASLRLASFVHETKQTNYLTIKISTCSELTFTNNNTAAIQRYRYKVTNHCVYSTLEILSIQNLFSSPTHLKQFLCSFGKKISYGTLLLKITNSQFSIKRGF